MTIWRCLIKFFMSQKWNKHWCHLCQISHPTIYQTWMWKFLTNHSIYAYGTKNLDFFTVNSKRLYHMCWKTQTQSSTEMKRYFIEHKETLWHTWMLPQTGREIYLIGSMLHFLNIVLAKLFHLCNWKIVYPAVIALDSIPQVYRIYAGHICATPQQHIFTMIGVVHLWCEVLCCTKYDFFVWDKLLNG